MPEGVVHLATCQSPNAQNKHKGPPAWWPDCRRLIKSSSPNRKWRNSKCSRWTDCHPISMRTNSPIIRQLEGKRVPQHNWEFQQARMVVPKGYSCSTQWCSECHKWQNTAGNSRTWENLQVGGFYIGQRPCNSISNRIPQLCWTPWHATTQHEAESWLSSNALAQSWCSKTLPWHSADYQNPPSTCYWSYHLDRLCRGRNHLHSMNPSNSVRLRNSIQTSPVSNQTLLCHDHKQVSRTVSGSCRSQPKFSLLQPWPALRCLLPRRISNIAVHTGTWRQNYECRLSSSSSMTFASISLK